MSTQTTNPFDAPVVDQPQYGVFTDIANEDYHAGAGLSSSGLKTYIKSPLHYHHEYVLGRRNSGQSPAMLKGTLVHTLILEPERLHLDYAVIESSTRTTNLYKEAMKGETRTGVLDKELGEAERIAEAVQANPHATGILKGAVCEHSVYWDENGQLCKCRPDIWRPDINIMADLKTAADASPSEFSRSIVKLGYHISAEWYLRGVEKATGVRPDSWAWIVVETSAPYAVMVYEASPAMLEKAAGLIDDALGALAIAHRDNHWPAYGSNGIDEIHLPAWAA